MLLLLLEGTGYHTTTKGHTTTITIIILLHPDKGLVSKLMLEVVHRFIQFLTPTWEENNLHFLCDDDILT
jgi:hypothetical protein